MPDLIQFVVSAFCAITVVLAVLHSSRMKYQSDTSHVSEESLIFLIRDGRIIDANFTGQRLLTSSSARLSGLERLRELLAGWFDDSERLLADDADQAGLKLQSRDQRTQAIRTQIGDTIRIKVTFITGQVPDEGDIHTLRALERELETLRANTSAAPFLLWRQNSKNEVHWVNKAYLDVAESATDYTSGTWPLPVLFPSLSKLGNVNSSESRRLSIQSTTDASEAWYDCHVTPIGQDLLCTAIPADEAVRSEFRRREFTQTLTKTFAELAIGLAIFDRSRRLVLFNPALLDLTNLPTDFLSSRPSLVGFLDRLRENRVMPEPRDYRSWRQSISELEAAAVDGTYSDTWSLPDGQTYHVTGRPHPDGAVALLFEDISAEMSLTRHFRTELEQSQSVLNVLEDAVVVFSPAGEITACNTAYKDLWRIDDTEFQKGDLAEATQKWHEMCAPTPIWGDFREFARSENEREEWAESVALLDGRRVYCRFAPQKGGGTVAIFRLESSSQEGRLQEAV